jgi:hypothetical protein
MMMIHKIVKYIVPVFMLLVAGDVVALQQNEGLWLAVNAQHSLSGDEKWRSFVYSQTRFLNQDRPWQVILVEGGLGYKPNQTSYWVGYRWSGRRPFNDFFQENRLFQQIIVPFESVRFKKVLARTRLEETQATDQNEISLRLRQRLAFEFAQSFVLGNLFPAIYDEVFFQLNKTDYTSHTLFSQNRVFLGFNWRKTQEAWWEVGYINQYQMSTPLNNQNHMNHIVSLTYNFG